MRSHGTAAAAAAEEEEEGARGDSEEQGGGGGAATTTSALRDVGAATELLRAWEGSVGSAASAMVDYQLGVIYLEAVCGLLVLGGQVFERVATLRQLRGLTPAELNGPRITAACGSPASI